MTSKVVLQGLEFHARHGVFEVESLLGSRFIVDIELYYPFAWISDDLKEAINYATVYEWVKQEVTEDQYQLIEVLASSIAQRILIEEERVERVLVRIHKPFAPVAGIFRDIYTELELDRKEIQNEDNLPIIEEVADWNNEIVENNEEPAAELELNEVFIEDVYDKIVPIENELAKELKISVSDIEKGKLYSFIPYVISREDERAVINRIRLNENLYKISIIDNAISVIEDEKTQVNQIIDSSDSEEEETLASQLIIIIKNKMMEIFKKGKLNGLPNYVKKHEKNIVVGHSIIDAISQYSMNEITYQYKGKKSLTTTYSIEGSIDIDQSDGLEHVGLHSLKDMLQCLLSYQIDFLKQERQQLKNTVLKDLPKVRDLDRKSLEGMQSTERYSFTAYISLGANLGKPLEQLRWAHTQLQKFGHCVPSRVYRTRPLGGPSNQPHYYNAAVQLHTDLNPTELLAALQSIEEKSGRVRAERWGPRTLDLDLIVYDDYLSDDPKLTLPHPRAWERAFVLLPLSDVNPFLTHPMTHETIEDALKNALQDDDQKGIEIIKDFRWW